MPSAALPPLLESLPVLRPAPVPLLTQALARLARELDPTPPPAAVGAAQLPVQRRTPHTEQVRFMTSPAKRKVIRAGRRGGKTVGVAMMAVEAFLAGRRVLYATPTDDQVSRFWFEVKHALQPALDAGLLTKNETRHFVEVPRTETRIRAKTAWDANTLRGDYCDLLVLDEFQLMCEDTWGLVGAPMLLDNNGDAIFVYTPPSVLSLTGSKAKDKLHAAKLYKAAAQDRSGRWATFHFSSHDNPYLSSDALDDIVQDMTSLAYRQEILAEDMEDIPGALWTYPLLDATRVTPAQVPDLATMGIALDPSATSQESSDEMGLIVAGLAADRQGYILHDGTLRGTPAACARRALQLYDQYQADFLVGEANNGGEWIETVIRLVAAEMQRQGERVTDAVTYHMVHATRGKQTRAAPIAAEYEHGRMHHVGTFPALEAEMAGWVPGLPSPNRMDALVWVLTELLGSVVIPQGLSLAANDTLEQAGYLDRAARSIRLTGTRRSLHLVPPSQRQRG